MMPKKTFRDAVNVPHKKIGEKIKKIKKNERPKTGGDKAKKIGKIAGLGLLEFITWAIKYGVFDNQITRKLEDVYAEMKIGKNKQGQNKKFSSWIKKHPEFSSYMTYWLAILMAIGVAKGGKFVQEKWNERADSKKEYKITEETAEFKNIKLDVKSEDFDDVYDQLEDLAVGTAVCWLETYREKPVQQFGEDVYTRGWGMTHSPDKKGHMFIRNWVKDDKKNGRKAHKPVETQSKDDDFEESEMYVRDYILDAIKVNMTRTITLNELVGIIGAGYQLPGHVKDICIKLNSAKTPQEIVDAFYVKKERFKGTTKRRYVCGLFAAGFLTFEDVLNLDIDAFYGISEEDDYKQIIENGHFKTDENTINDVKAMKKPARGSVRNMLNSFATGKEVLKMIESGHVTINKKDEAYYTACSLDLQALDAFKQENYEEALDLWQDALELQPTDAQIMDNMVAAYIKNEQYNMALNMAAKIINGGYTKQFKTAYYNIGLAYEGLGQIENALDAYKKAKEYGNESADKKISELQGTVRLDKRNAYKQGTQRINAKAHNVIKHTPQKRNMA